MNAEYKAYKKAAKAIHDKFWGKDGWVGHVNTSVKEIFPFLAEINIAYCEAQEKKK